MFKRLPGAFARAVLVVIVLSMPAFLLPDISRAAQEISLIIGGIVAAFTLFEYASTHPGLVDFRFAPPYNRIRFFTFSLQVLLLVFLARATMELDPFSPDIIAFADWCASLLNFPLSPVNIAVAMVGDDGDADFRLLIERAAALSYAVAFSSMIFFALVLWLFKWPVGRDNFNLWVNLPTFEPASGHDVERRLNRDGMINILVGIGLPYVIPAFVSRASGWFDPSVLDNSQPLIWGCTIWSFLPASLVIRGAALLKVGYLVRRSRPTGG
ncbi:hypothetical protein [Oceanomicrobium pacificus]|uniref:Uncharacterized protein n=1 Tax=Oceanomicrobium pacificus TaxID=2692916 RepID=A0A6B0TJF7_9RHOB|nr:hypothetical protein [Oceanomicrobium pacificus]MXU64600.1 hypothetical protein [Oceanomicrobium pacificus]